MSHEPQPFPGDTDARADELRELAGPVNGHREDNRDDAGAPSNEPDARTDPDIDEVLAEPGDDDVPAEVEDPYELRSMGTQPNPTEDDPGSYLNA